MCYRYPGPKCGTHIQAKIDALTAKTPALLEDATFLKQQLDNASAEITSALNARDESRLATARKTHAGLHKKFTRATEKLEAHQFLIQGRTNEYDATLEGIAYLENEVSKKRTMGNPVSDEQARLKDARTRYDDSIYEYDKLFGTVNCRKPAVDFSDDAMEKTRDSIRKLDKSIADLHRLALAPASTAEDDKEIAGKIAKVEIQKDKLNDKLSHMSLTYAYTKNGMLPDREAAARFRRQAAEAASRGFASYETSDSDGAGTQFAAGITADANRLKAEIADNKGLSEFRALFDLDGNYVHANYISTRFGMAWGVYSDPENPDLGFSHFVNESKSKDPQKQEALLAKKGYALGRIMAPAYVTSFGENLVSVRNIILQNHHKTNNRTVEVLSVNVYAEAEEESTVSG